MYVDQTLGTLTNVDAKATFTLSANLIRILGQVSSGYANGWGSTFSPTVAGAGVTIGFANATTGQIYDATSISYSASYAAGDPTPYNGARLRRGPPQRAEWQPVPPLASSLVSGSIRTIQPVQQRGG